MQILANHVNNERLSSTLPPSARPSGPAPSGSRSGSPMKGAKRRTSFATILWSGEGRCIGAKAAPVRFRCSCAADGGDTRMRYFVRLCDDQVLHHADLEDIYGLVFAR